MTDDQKTLAESHSAEAVQAAAIHAEAIEKARMAQVESVVKEHQDRAMDVFMGQYTQIMTTLATLVAGQNNTNKHLEILNGKVAAHEEKLTTLMLWRAEAKGFVGAIGVGWTTLITLFSGAAGAIIIWLVKK
jgi:hypothetical protein